MAQISFRAALLAGAVAVASATGSMAISMATRPALAQDSNTQETAPATGDSAAPADAAAPATGDSTAPAAPDDAAPAAPDDAAPAAGDNAAPAAGDQSGTPQPATPGGAQPAPADPNEVVATIGDQKITRKDVIDSAADLPPQYMAQIDRIFPQLLNRLIGLRLLVAKGREEGLAEDATVKRFVQQAEDQAISQAYLQKLVEKDVSEDSIKAVYDADLKEHPPQIEIRASHILVKTEDEAKAIIKQLQDGGDFAKIAAEKSIDTQSAKNGGDLDWFTKDTMVKEFSDAAFSMQRGDVSKVPVKTQFGWHIIKITDSRMQTPVPLEQRRDDIRKALSQEAVHKEVQDLITQANVQYGKDDYKLPGAPAPQ